MNMFSERPKREAVEVSEATNGSVFLLMQLPLEALGIIADKVGRN